MEKKFLTSNYKTGEKRFEIRNFLSVTSSFLGSTACCLLHIINKLLHSSFPSCSVIVSLPVLSLIRKVGWNRSRNSGHEQPSSQSRVQRFLQIFPFGLRPVDVEFRFNLIPVFFQTLLNNSLAITNFVNLRLERYHVIETRRKAPFTIFIEKLKTRFIPHEPDLCRKIIPLLHEIREILDLNSIGTDYHRFRKMLEKKNLSLQACLSVFLQ